jgi:hypothetical protein
MDASCVSQNFRRLSPKNLDESPGALGDSLAKSLLRHHCLSREAFSG